MADYDWYLDDSVSPMLLKRFDDETFNLTVEYIIEDDKTLRVTGFNGTLDIVEVKTGMITGDWSITGIGNNAFKLNTRLTSIEFLDVITIGEYCFSQCSDLETVNFPKVQSVGPYAFESCFALTTLDLPEVINIDEGGFCSSRIQTITIPKAQTLGDYSFSYCAHLTNINFPLVTGIGINTFNNCYHLNNVYLPKVTSLGARVFEGASIKSLYLNSVTSLPYDYRFTSSNIQHLYVPSLQSMGSFNFIFATRIPSTIYMPKITAIDAYAFSTIQPS